MVPVTRKNKPQQKRAPDLDTGSPYVTGIVNWRLTMRPHVWRPATDVYETENAIIVRVELAGMDQSDFSIVFSQNNLSISGVRQDTADKKAFHQIEIPFGEFKTEIKISQPVDPDNIEAEYSNGLLIVTLPITQPRYITIQEDK